jgi:hypothetical protein
VLAAIAGKPIRVPILNPNAAKTRPRIPNPRRNGFPVTMGTSNRVQSQELIQLPVTFDFGVCPWRHTKQNATWHVSV